MKQIETDLNVPVEAKSEVEQVESSSAQRSKPPGSTRTGTMQPGTTQTLPSTNHSLKPKAGGWQKALILTASMAASATLGFAAALMLPLPMGLVAKDQDTRSLNLWQVGLGYRVGRPVNILVMGIDRVPAAKTDASKIFSGRSDTMLLLRVDPTADSVSLLSIPRDTQIEVPGVGIDKINDANVQGGATLAAQTVSATLNGVAIDRYVRISTDAFKELVDLLGGVEVYVPKPMVYEDKTQKLKINLSPGLQTLDGDQAEQFARFRGDDLGDIGRVQRQQALLKALRQKLTSPTVIPKIPGLIQSMQKYIDTNLSTEEMLALVGAGRKLSEGKFKMVMLPGRFSSPDEYVASYWILNPEGRDRVMKQYFGVEPPSATETGRSLTSLRIAVQNASRNSTAASQMRQHLSGRGFNDTYISSDWADQQAQTLIIAQQGDLDAAEALQKALGIGKVEADSTGDLESDITIRIGNDWLKK